MLYEVITGLSAKKYTVLLIPEGSHQVRRFVLRRFWFRLTMMLGTAFLIGVGGLGFEYYRINVDRNELGLLRLERRSRQQDLQRLKAGLEELRQELMLLSQNDAKVRVLAKLSKPKPDTLTGIGGPVEEDAPGDFSAAQRQIDEIMQSIDMRRVSQEELYGVLNDERSLLGAKPKGWPTRGWVTSGFGMRRSPFTGKRDMHEGLDIAARTGTPVYATADGIVSRAETRNNFV